MSPSDVIYLDAHATTPLEPAVAAEMERVRREAWGNPASQHRIGRRAAEVVESARTRIAGRLGCAPEEIIFTSGATEANNLLIKGLVLPLWRRWQAGRAPDAPHVVTTRIEHRSVLDPLRRLHRWGVPVTWLDVDRQGRVHPEAVAAAIRANTVLVSVIWANNEIGTVQPVGEIAEICRRHRVALHSDAVQAVGRLEVDCRAAGVDALSLSAHKFGGPQGVGALVIARRLQRHCEPLLDGGGHERHLRSGTLPVELIAGLAAALEHACAHLGEVRQHLTSLQERLLAGLQNGIADLVVNGPLEDRLPGNLNVSIPGVDGSALWSRLEGLAVSSGAACSSAEPEPSHVLQAIGVPEELARATLRFGIGPYNTPADIDRAVDIVCAAVGALRSGQ